MAPSPDVPDPPEPPEPPALPASPAVAPAAGDDRRARPVVVGSLALAVVVVIAVVVVVRLPRNPTGQPPRPTGTAAPLVEGVTWRTVASAPTERAEVAATRAGDGRIYVVGGFDSAGGTLATVEIYDPRGNTWSVGPSLPVAVNHPMAASASGQPYVFGGYGADGQATVGAFRFDGTAWRAVAPMPHARAAATAVTMGERVFVAGGIGANGKPVRELLEYDPGVDRWSIEPEMPTPREHLGGASFGGKVYTVGGRAPGTGNLAAFEAYDPRSRTWESLPDLPTRRGGLAATATCNGQIVAVGGEADVTFFEAEAFDVASGTWRSLPGTPTARHGLGVVADGATVHVIDGGRVPGLSTSDLDESIDLSVLGPCR